MTWDALTAIATVAAAIVASAALLLVYIQVSHVKRQLKSSTNVALYEQMIAIDRYFVDRPALKPFIYGNKTISNDDVDYGKIRSLAEMMSDLMEHAYIQKDNLPCDVWPGWVAYMRDLYDASPTIRQHLHESATWYAGNILREIGRDTVYSGQTKIGLHKTAKEARV